MSELKKYIFPGVLILIGLILIINGFNTEQNGAFFFGAIGVLIAGLVSLAATMMVLSKTLRLGISAGLVLVVVGLSYADFMAIKVPIDFQNEKDRRYVHVIQRLKDIRTAEIAYKAKYQKYQGNIDSLVDFVKHDSLLFIKAIGEVPDTMSLEDALKAGLVSRDTFYVNTLDSLFGPRVQEERAHPFDPDSMIIVPFTGGTKFNLESNMVKMSNVDVPVFQATDSKPFDRRDVLQVGSLSDPKTNGNWE